MTKLIEQTFVQLNSTQLIRSSFATQHERPKQKCASFQLIRLGDRQRANETAAKRGQKGLPLKKAN